MDFEHPNHQYLNRSFCWLAKRAINEHKLEEEPTQLTGQEGPVGGFDALQVSQNC